MIDISVVIPTYRRPQQLVEAIDSALAQNASIEIIVVDDSPEGSAREVMVNYAAQPLIYLHRNPPSGGKPALVRNSGWPMARGRFVHFLDDDDRVAAGFYQAAITSFDARPRTGVVFGRIEPFGNNAAQAMTHEHAFFAEAGRRGKLAARFGSRYWLVANLLFKPTLLVNSACMIRRECLPSLDGYDASLGLNEDVDFFCRAIRQFGYAFVDQVVLHYRINSDSLMHGREDDTKLVDAYQKMYARYKAAHGVAEFLAIKLLARTVLSVL